MATIEIPFLYIVILAVVVGCTSGSFFMLLSIYLVLKEILYELKKVSVKNA